MFDSILAFHLIFSFYFLISIRSLFLIARRFPALHYENEASDF